jgi:uncharacterized membrane protein YagU involved in acid resistance
MVQLQHIGEAQAGRSWLQGGIAGFIATGPMSLFMVATQRFLPKRQQYALPPEIITEELAHRTHLRWHMNKKQVKAATVVSHFGYGAAMGMLYGLLAKKVSLPSPVKGILFGLVVWAASYLAMLPLIGMSESGQREPGKRNLMMIAAHAVWGAAMGLVAEIFAEKRV